MENGHKPDLDLSGFLGQRISVKVDDYEFSLPADVPTPLFVRLVKALNVLGEALQGDEKRTMEQVGTANEEVWGLVEEILQGAQPQPPRPVRELFTSATALSFLAFLAKRFKEVTNSTGLSPSQPSTTAPLP